MKVFKIIKAVAVWVILVISVSMMLFTVASSFTVDKTDRSLFGYKFFIVQSDSMKATDFAAGDLIITKEVDDLSTLKAGDIITFLSQNEESRNQVITHKIREVTRDAEGGIAFKTYGTTTGKDDDALATMILGKYQFAIPKVGYFLNFLRTVPGYIICILIPFLILIISQGVNCVRLFRRYRAEQMADLVAEREKLEAEREESRKMMEELLALKEQLANKEEPKVSESTAAETPAAPPEGEN